MIPNQPLMLTVIPTTEELQDAAAFANTYNTQGYGKNKLGVAHDEFIDFIRIGKLAELCVARLLRGNALEVDDTGILEPAAGANRHGADMKLCSTPQKLDS